MHDGERLRELRYFLEGVCCDIARFQHVRRDGVAPEAVRIEQEVFVGPDAYADIRVELPDGSRYYVEIKYGYSQELIVRHLARKYGALRAEEGTRVVVVVDAANGASWEETDRQLHASGLGHIAFEPWDEARLFALLRDAFDVKISSLADEELVDVQAAIDFAKGTYAFGDGFRNDPLQSSLLWHLSYWKLRRLLSGGRSPREILQPGLYREAITVFADLSSFSSYVRDTRDDRIVRDSLTSFYAKARYQILNSGGMMYQFLGDGVVAIFGVPDEDPDCATRAIECARALVDIGESVSRDWQRQIDHLQSASGAHVGIASGDLNIVPLRPFSRAHIGAIADSINTAARVSGVAAGGEIVATNSFYRRLPQAWKEQFAARDAVEARNIGRIQVWTLRVEGRQPDA